MQDWDLQMQLDNGAEARFVYAAEQRKPFDVGQRITIQEGTHTFTGVVSFHGAKALTSIDEWLSPEEATIAKYERWLTWWCKSVEFDSLPDAVGRWWAEQGGRGDV